MRCYKNTPFQWQKGEYYSAYKDLKERWVPTVPTNVLSLLLEIFTQRNIWGKSQF